MKFRCDELNSADVVKDSFYRSFKIIFCLMLTVVFLPLYSEDSKNPKVEDSEIKKALKTEFSARPTLSAETIQIEVEDGIVTLTGEVANLLSKERAKEIAMMLRGVRDVKNNLSLRDAERSDEEIRRNVQRALLLNAATDSYELGVDVKNGVVTISGDVDSWNESYLSQKVAMGVAGVRQVNNSIAFRYDQNRTDAEIRAGIKEMLRFDTQVNDALINVNVENGNVSLSGKVESASEKQQALFDAWIAGVKAVDTAELEVDPEIDDEVFKKGKFQKRTDGDIRAAIINSMFLDARVRSYNIKVDATNGVVTLSGQADNLGSKRAAEEIAKNTVGVSSVKNNITIEAGNLPDSELKKDVEEALLIDPLVDGYGIDAEVNNNKVTLKGTVDTYYEKFHAESVAAMVTGVSSIENALKVKETYSVIYYDYMEPVELAPRKADGEIEDDIESQIWWSPFVDAEEVDVMVNAGKATLVGEVDSWNEEKSAIENAYEGGAISVDSRLIIDNT